MSRLRSNVATASSPRTPGHGASGKPIEPAAHAGRTRVGDLIALLDHAGIECAVLIGHSMGGVAALAATAFVLEDVEAVVAICARPFAEDLAPLRAVLARGLEDWTRLGGRRRAAFAGDPCAARREWRGRAVGLDAGAAVAAAERLVHAEKVAAIVGAGCSGNAPASADTATLRAIFVHPLMARRGIASRIVERLEAEARGNGATRTTLLATLTARRLYERLGYRVLGACDLPLEDALTFPTLRMDKEFARPAGNIRAPLRGRGASNPGDLTSVP